MKQIPKWLSKVLVQEDLHRIREAVTQAEKKTSAEIVPMIVRSSILTGHVEVILFLGTLLLYWTLAAESAPYLPNLSGWVLELSAAVLAIATSWLLREATFFQRLLTSPHDQAMSVLHRAQLEFYQSNIKATHRHTGVLVFVSLLERRAVILADEPVAKQIPEDIWEQIIGALIDKTKSGDFTGGMCHAVDAIGGVMTEKFPIHIGDKSELSNQLVIKE